MVKLLPGRKGKLSEHLKRNKVDSSVDDPYSNLSKKPLQKNFPIKRVDLHNIGKIDIT